MRLPDSNVWLALALSGHVHHEICREWLDAISGCRMISFCRATQQSLLRLLSTKAVLAPYGNRPLTTAESWVAYQQFLADDRISFAAEPEGLEPVWATLACRESASPKLWMDAYLAAFAMAGGYTLVTTDKAFRQHEGLELLLLKEGE